MQDKVMIKFMTIQDGEEVRICSFYTSCFAEWLKTLQVAKENGISFYPREDDENIDSAFSQLGYEVDDFNVSFGSDICIQTIEVWLK